MQTTQTAAPLASRGGELFGDDHVIDTKVSTPATSGGLFVCRDAADDKCKAPTSASEVQDTGFGFVVFDAASAPADGATADYDAGQTVPVMSWGRMWVQSEEAMAIGDAVYVRYSANGGNTVLGKIRNDADTSHCALLSGARVIQASTSTNPALISLEGMAKQIDVAAVAAEVAALQLGQVNVPLGEFRLTAGTPLIAAEGDDTATPEYVNKTSAMVMQWQDNATPTAAWASVPLPQDLDDTAAIEIHVLASKSGTTSTSGDVTTFTIAAYFQTVGALYDADTDHGGATGAVTAGTAKAVREVSLSIAENAVPASPSVLTFSMKPTDGTLTTDDVYVHGVWIEYTRKVA